MSRHQHPSHRTSWVRRLLVSSTTGLLLIVEPKYVALIHSVLNAQQDPCPDIAIAGRTDLDDPKLMLDTCRIEPEGYAVRNTTLGQPLTRIIVHGRAVVEGHCTIKYPTGIPPVCMVTYDRDRANNGIQVTYNRPGNPEPNQPETLNPIYGKPANVLYQLLDSEDLDHSTGPRQFDLVEFGRYAVQEEGLVFTTACGIGPPTTGRKTVGFYAINCRPQWNLVDGTNNILHLPPGTTITLNPPERRRRCAKGGHRHVCCSGSERQHSSRHLLDRARPATLHNGRSTDCSRKSDVLLRGE
jgi:hypothetical protein